MPGPDSFVETGTKGKPISRIDHRFDKGDVFDSGRNRGIGVQIVGYIHLSKSGEWQFRVHSNDGIEVVIEETLVVSDPVWHSDRFSDPMGLQVEKPGWHPILLRYFQRKGTATLKFYWKPSGEHEFRIVPEEAYRHLPTS
jgi:PA14 domain-containing protein